MIETAKKEHADAAARLHLEAFPESFLSSLGTEFLRLVYLEFAGDAGTAAAACVVDGAVAGFAACTRDTGRFWKRVFARRAAEVWKILLKRLAASPGIFRGVIRRAPEVARYFIFSAFPGAGRRDDGAFVVLTVGVSPSRRREGIGRALVERLASDARAMGGEALKAYVDGENAAGRSFFEACGFAETAAVKRPAGRVMVMYERRLA
ncbi:MAG: GNAT family N-acetyltransferase [bacterium]